MAETDLHWMTVTPFAHRGYWRGEESLAENSPAGFEAAASRGFGVELDVQLTADGGAVAFHDPSLERLTTATGPVNRQTMVELASIPLRGSPYGETIPPLEAALRIIDGRVPVLIEIKPQRTVGPLEAAVADVLGRYDHAAAVMSFSPASMGWFRMNAPDVVRGLVGSTAYRSPHTSWLSRSSRYQRLAMASTDARFLAYDIRRLPTSLTRAVRDQGLPVLTWTVRSDDDRDRAARWADNMIFEMSLASGARLDHAHD